MNAGIPIPIRLAVAAAAFGITAMQGAALDHLSRHQGMASTTPRVYLERVVINGNRVPAQQNVASASAPDLR